MTAQDWAAVATKRALFVVRYHDVTGDQLCKTALQLSKAQDLRFAFDTMTFAVDVLDEVVKCELTDAQTLEP